MSTTYLEKTVGQLVAEQPARSRVFERWGIDYCCGGKKPVAEACAAKGVDAEAVLKDLEACDTKSPRPTVDWLSLPMTELCDHIESTHHAYLREALPRLSYLTHRVANAHGERDAWLIEIRDIFDGFRAELEQHMMKEERILFPMIRQLEGSEGAASFHCGSIQNPIRQMVVEHDDAGEALEKFRTITSGYQAPSNACNTYRALYQALEELELDMHQHVHKENNILFSRAAELEGKS